MVDVFTPVGRHRGGPAPGESVKKVGRGGVWLQSLESKEIVLFALCLVAEYLVSGTNFLKGMIGSPFIRVVLFGKAKVSLFNLLGSGTLTYLCVCVCALKRPERVGECHGLLIDRYH